METKEYYYDKLKEVLSTYMSESNINEINKYYECANKIHEGEVRDNGEEYICHMIRVATILAELGMNTLTIGCSLIHEAVAQDKMSEEEINTSFGEEAYTILNALSKLSHLKRNLDFGNTDKYRRIVVGLSENPISLFIKLADRLDTLRNPINDKRQLMEEIDETEKIYIPIAHRLGIKSMKSELEDLCLQLSSPELYKEVKEKIGEEKESLESSLLKMRDELIDILNEHNIKYDMTYRVKSVRGIYNKLKAGKKWEQIYDLLGLRILVEKVEECYLVIGLVHSKFRPIPTRFKDYIANPKSNMYQSIHTTVFGVDSKMYEIQVRTYEMNEIAERGVASHWSYKEKTDGSKTGELEEKLMQFRTLIEVNDLEGNKDFFKDLNNALPKEDIYIFTPKGDVIELPIGSCPVDFAYKIHSEVGNTCTGALVNGKLVSLDYHLQDGDIVSLMTQKGKSPSKAWLKFVKTDSAKSRIRSYFYKKEKESSTEAGKELIISEIKKHKYSPNDLLKEEIVDKLLENMKCESLDEIALGVATLKYTPNSVVNKLIDIAYPKEDDTIEKLLENTDIIKNTENGKILIAGYGDILTSLASCCHPVLGDEIIGYITKGNGITIHRKDCKVVNKESERIITAQWNDKVADKYITTLTVYIDTTNDNLVDLITVATKSETIISSINNKGRKSSVDVYELICKVKNKECLDRFINDISALKFVERIER